jgi:hypothetical protein
VAFGAFTIIEVQNGGNDANGGGFNPANASMATDLVATSGNTASPVVTSASYNFVAGDVGAWVFIKAGTNWLPGWYQIASVAANAATLTAGVGTAPQLANNEPSYMNTAVGCAAVASPTGGTWTIDYSQQAAAPFAFTDMVIDGTTNTKFTSAAKPVGKNFVGNIINVTSGTGFTVQRVEVVSTSGTVATCDKSLGTLSSTGGNGNLGGALATIGQGGAFKVLCPAGADVFLKYNATPQTLTSDTANVSGGRYDDTVGGTLVTNVSWLSGYDTHRIHCNSDANRPTIKARSGSTTQTLVTFSGGNWTGASNLILDGDGANTTSITGLAVTNSYGHLFRVHVQNTEAYGLKLNPGLNCYYQLTACSATNCSGTAGISLGSGCSAYALEVYNNLTHGVLVEGDNVVIGRSVARGNTTTGAVGGGGNVDGFGIVESTYSGWVTFDCVSRDNGRAGYNWGDTIARRTRSINCLAYGNGGEGWRTASVIDSPALINCAGGSNTSGNYNAANLPNVIGFINLTADPHTTATNLAPNNTAGGGAALQLAGWPTTYPAGLTANGVDVGGVQHPLLTLIQANTMAGGPIYPSSVYHADTAGRTFPNYYAGAGGNAAAHDLGIGVKASLDADATVEFRFPLPPALPTGTLKLRILALANATSGVAKLTVSDGTATPAASPGSAGNPSAVTLAGESQTTITWAASENDRYKDSKVTLATVPAANDVLVVAVKFQSSGWTLAQVATFLLSLIWE